MTGIPFVLHNQHRAQRKQKKQDFKKMAFSRNIMKRAEPSRRFSNIPSNTWGFSAPQRCSVCKHSLLQCICILSDKDIISAVSRLRFLPLLPIHLQSRVLTRPGSSDQILFQWRGECVGDPTLVRHGQMKAHKHAVVPARVPMQIKKWIQAHYLDSESVDLVFMKRQK